MHGYNMDQESLGTAGSAEELTQSDPTDPTLPYIQYVVDLCNYNVAHIN